jgi:NDP-sugar pyrophosphorylase family protein
MTEDEETFTYKPQETLSYEESASLLHESGKVRYSKDSTRYDTIVLVPDKFDVLCGRDSESISHLGTKRFRTIIDMNRERYQNAKTRDDKYRITDETINAIGGYFLRKDLKTNKWHDIGHHEAHEKVSHALRSAKDPKMKCPRKQKTIVPENRIQEENCNLVYETLLSKQQCICGELIIEDLFKDEEDEVALGCAEGDHLYDEWLLESIVLM